MSNQPAINYIKSLDGVRAFALTLVLVYHGSYGTIKGGWIGVDLFFVLSGYLISTLLLNEYSHNSQINLKNFYIRRLLRLLPPLIIGVILANITWSYSNFYGTPNRYIASLASIFYMANLLGSYMGNLSHVWSLSVEEHFYLLWPVFGAYYLFKKKLFNRVVHLIGMILLISVMRIYIFNMHEIPKIGPFTIDYYSFTFTRIDGILYGVILAMVLYELKPRLEVHLLKYKAILAAIIMVVFILISLFLDKANTQLNNFGFIFTNIFCTCTVLFAVIFNDTKLLSNRLMKWLGQRSYGIYVYHLPIFLVLEQFRHQNSVSNLILVTLFRFGLTFLVAELSFRFAEKPILKLKRHFEFKLI